METPKKTDPLETGIGTKEGESLKPTRDIIKNVMIEMQKDKTGKDVGDKVVFYCEYPGKEDLIKISSAKYENKSNKLVVTGTWYSLDEDGLLKKNSAISKVLQTIKVNTLKESINKELDTTLDDNGYLAIKSY